MEWGLYILMFIFGYVTCKALYFYRATRLALSLLRASQLISISLLAKGMENFSHGRMYRLQKMLESEESTHNINAFNYRYEEEIARYKKNSIDTLIYLHPKFFDPHLEFDDWKSAMKFINQHKEVMASFFAEGKPND
jgi:hypothetical protein